MSDSIQANTEDHTAWITLNHPPLHILDIPMMLALDAAFRRVIPKADFVVFQGAGFKAFSAGVDIADHTPKRVGIRAFLEKCAPSWQSYKMGGSK